MGMTVDTRPPAPVDPNAGAPHNEPDVMKQPPPAGANALAWNLSNPAERQQMLDDLAAPARAGAVAGQAAQLVPPPSLKDTVAGTQPKPGVDLPLALIANDVYDPNPVAGTTSPAPRAPAYHAELATTGWQRLSIEGDHVVDSNGKRLAIDPKLLYDPVSGADAGVYSNGKGQYVVAFAGTLPTVADLTADPDVKTDVEQGAGVSTAQYDQAVLLAKQAQGVAGQGNVAFTGHSLGGGLAVTAALATGEAAVTFNASGPSNDTIRDATDRNPNDVRQDYATNGLVRSYSVAGEPLTTLDESGGPEQLGTQWTTPNTRPGVTADNLGDFIALHGLPGDDQLYVDGLKTGDIRPGYVPNTAVSTLLDAVLPGTTPTQRNTVGNLLGGVADLIKDTHNDAIQAATQIRTDVAAAQRDPDAGTPIRVTGALLNASGDLFGRAVENGFKFVGRELTALTDGGGSELRALGQRNGVSSLTDPVASVLENAGNRVRKGLDATGHGISAAADHLGDGVAWAANKAGDAQQAVASAADQANRWVQEQQQRAAAAVQRGAVAAKDAALDLGFSAVAQGVRGAIAVKNAADDVVRSALPRVAEGIVWAEQQAQKVENGVNAAGDWVEDRARDVKRIFDWVVA
jgi:hypothetical protein